MFSQYTFRMLEKMCQPNSSILLPANYDNYSNSTTRMLILAQDSSFSFVFLKIYKRKIKKTNIFFSSKTHQ